MHRTGIRSRGDCRAPPGDVSQRAPKYIPMFLAVRLWLHPGTRFRSACLPPWCCRAGHPLQGRRIFFKGHLSLGILLRMKGPWLKPGHTQLAQPPSDGLFTYRYDHRVAISSRRSKQRQRVTVCRSGSGPLIMISLSSSICASVRTGVRPGPVRDRNPDTPSSL